jgi:Tir chaperone protein (CesT) family
MYHNFIFAAKSEFVSRNSSLVLETGLHAVLRSLGGGAMPVGIDNFRAVAQSNLGNAPTDTSDQMELYRELLQTTRQLYLSTGASLALEPESGELVFNVSIELADLTSAKFEDFLDQILQIVSPLINRLDQPVKEESDPNAPEVPSAWTRV